MTNEGLMCRLSEGDESALDKLCENNRVLVRERARRIALTYNCVRFHEQGQQTDYTKETLSELESVGMLAFIECIRSGRYDSELGSLTTYAVPFIDGAMRRHLESSLGTLSLDRGSMTQVRRVQRLHYGQGKSMVDIAEELGISEPEAAKHAVYPTHFLSVHDLTDADEDNDVFYYIAEDRSNTSPDEIIYRRIRMEYLRELFDALPRKERDILGKCYGVFGYPKTPLGEIAMYHMMKVDAVEKAKERALKKLRNSYPGSKMQRWSTIHWLLEHIK